MIFSVTLAHKEKYAAFLIVKSIIIIVIIIIRIVLCTFAVK